MTPELTTNLCDSAIADASPELVEILNTLGQDSSYGYRRALLHLFDKHPAIFFQSAPTIVEQTIQVLNVVVFGTNVWEHHALGKISYEKAVDLCAFFIERMKFSTSAVGAKS